MRSRSLLFDMQKYLRAELEAPLDVARRSALSERMNADRSRLMREVEHEVQHESAEPRGLFRRVLVAVDSSPQAMAAIEVAARLPGAAEVCLVHVVDNATNLYEGFAAPVSIVNERRLARERGRILLVSAAERFDHARPAEEPSPVVRRHVMEGPVVMQIAEAAKEFDADVIVIGTHARRGISHFLMGSTAEGVVRQSACPVICVPEKR